MTKDQQRNTSNSQSSMAPSEANYAITASPGHSSTSEAQPNDLKANFMEMIEDLKG